ncbi:uncharacterized protein TNCV_2674221 [Trichonephila clavipes]|nr:uncharacterized protein TNCV_2674221 [Trichonephila clavipes]
MTVSETLNWKLHPRFVESDEDVLKTLCTVLLLLDHLRLIASHCDRNKMTPQGLAMAFGPVLMCHAETPTATVDIRRPIDIMNFLVEMWPNKRKLEVNEDDIEELIMGHEDELTIELQEILNEEHEETQRNVSPSEQQEDERGPMPTSAIKDLLKKWEAVRAVVLEWHPNQAGVSRVGDLYNDNVINYFRKILKKREKQSTLDMFFNAQ